MAQIFISSDHNGFQLKNQLVGFLQSKGHDIVDVGPKELNPEDDFPLAAANVASEVIASKQKDARGILICGSGQGVCMAANRFRGIRASLGYDEKSVRSARNDDDANILCLPAHELTLREAESLVITWLNTPFAGATRFKRRIREMDTF